MREIRTSGSEGGGALTGSPYPYMDLYAPSALAQVTEMVTAPKARSGI
jgi:hypothetical protein